MPSRNIVKTYVKDGIYHVYNRGVEKRNIFEDNQDYNVFRSYLRDSLAELSNVPVRTRVVNVQGSTFSVVQRLPKNFVGIIELLAYCLMPNHFHLLIKQNDDKSLQVFMKSLCTRYSMYFNKRYDRVGPLFQGIYKAALVAGDEYLLHVSRYIHLNPLEPGKNLFDAHSSFANYLKLKNTTWVKTELILSYFEKGIGQEFKKFNSYRKFVESSNVSSTKILGNLAIDNI